MLVEVPGRHLASKKVGLDTVDFSCAVLCTLFKLYTPLSRCFVWENVGIDVGDVDGAVRAATARVTERVSLSPETHHVFISSFSYFIAPLFEWVILPRTSGSRPSSTEKSIHVQSRIVLHIRRMKTNLHLSDERFAREPNLIVNYIEVKSVRT